MKKQLITLISVTSMIYIGACGIIYSAQRSLIYYPTPESLASQAEHFSFISAGETLKIWQFGENPSNALIYFGGNAEDVSGNIPLFKKLFPDYTVYLVNYRGYGGSTGAPSEEGLFLDSLAIFDYLRENHANISVIGRSLGSGVATYLASMRDVDRLILVTPFDSIKSLAKKFYPILPITVLLKDKYESTSYAENISAPTLVVIAEHDEVIPRENSEALVSSFSPSHVSVTVIAGSSHNTVGAYPEYAKALGEFLARQPVTTVTGKDF